ncbi:MAG: hypothetical protein ACRDYZ_13085 [Acidimicrobiales bacterium]
MRMGSGASPDAKEHGGLPNGGPPHVARFDQVVPPSVETRTAFCCCPPIWENQPQTANSVPLGAAERIARWASDPHGIERFTQDRPPSAVE